MRGDVVLDHDEVVEGAVVGFGPEDVAGVGADEAGGDADLIAGFADTAVEDIGDAEVSGDGGDGKVFVAVVEGCGGGGDSEAGELAELVGELFGEAVGELALVHAFGQVEEGEDGDGLLRGAGRDGGGGMLAGEVGVDQVGGGDGEAEEEEGELEADGVGARDGWLGRG